MPVSVVYECGVDVTWDATGILQERIADEDRVSGKCDCDEYRIRSLSYWTECGWRKYVIQ